MGIKKCHHANFKLKKGGLLITMQTEQNTKLTSAEISQLWTAYYNESLAICIFSHFLNNVEDAEIKSVLNYSFELAQTHIEKLKLIFEKETFPLPVGFKLSEDVDLRAPRLFTDTYYLNFVAQLGSLGLTAYSMAVSFAVRKDINEFFIECLRESTGLHTMTNEILLSKGLYIKSPITPIPNRVDFVKKDGFLKGFFGDVRPLSVVEITNLYANIQRNAIGAATMIGFSQVAKDPKVKNFILKGKNIAKRHIEAFSKIMKNDDLPIPMTWDADVTESTEFTFSDKLILSLTTYLIGISIANYGVGISTSPRNDLAVQYGLLATEIGQYAKEGIKILIENEWLEQPPLASDRDKLIHQ